MAAVWFCPAELPGECNLVLHADNKVVNTAQFSPDGETLRFGVGFTSLSRTPVIGAVYVYIYIYI
jgi:hypothetical protein